MRPNSSRKQRLIQKKKKNDVWYAISEILNIDISEVEKKSFIGKEKR